MIQLISWDSATNRDRAELVFENRNKEYGAYQIRRNYERQLIAALFYTMAALGLLVAIPVIKSLVAKEPEVKKATKDDIVEFTTPPVTVPKTIPLPLVQQSRAVRSIQFTVPQVTVNITDDPPTQAELGTNNPGTITQDGPAVADLPPVINTMTEEGPPASIVEEMPVFPGGDQKLMEFLAKNIRYPRMAIENNITGVVFVSFVIAKDGNVKDAKIIHSLNRVCDEEALRVINSMPQWKPGRQNGSLVPVLFTVPVRFSLKQ